MFNHIYRLTTYPKALSTDKSYGHKLLPGTSQEGPFLPVVCVPRIYYRERTRGGRAVNWFNSSLRDSEGIVVQEVLYS